MFTDEEKGHIIASFRLVVPNAEIAGELFFRRLFEIHPEYRLLFPEDLSKLKLHLVETLAFAVRSLTFSDAEWRNASDPHDDLLLFLLALGRRLAELYKAPGDAYASASEALIWMLEYGLGGAFTPPIREAWTSLCARSVATLRLASGANGNDDPLLSSFDEWSARAERAFAAQASALNALASATAQGHEAAP